MREPVSRRSFLLASAGVVAAATAACKSGGGDDEVKVTKEDTAPKPPADISLVVASYVHVAGIEERVTMAFIRPDGPFSTESKVDFTIDGAPVQATRYAEGITLPYYLIRRRFERPGVHDVVASFEGKRLNAALEVKDLKASPVPVPGQALISTPTPTVANPQGVEPICTLKPACPLHDVSLDAALAERRPMAVLFATPALCQSALCGPVLQNLLAVRDEFGPKVRMLHVEIFADDKGQKLAPAVKAYKLQSEPFLFLADANGVVKERLDNAFDRKEVREALGRLTAA